MAPVLAAIGNQTVNEQATLTFTATATDADLPAKTLTYSLDAASIALGMSINADDGRLQLDADRGPGRPDLLGDDHGHRQRHAAT